MRKISITLDDADAKDIIAALQMALGNLGEEQPIAEGVRRGLRAFVEQAPNQHPTDPTLYEMPKPGPETEGASQ